MVINESIRSSLKSEIPEFRSLGYDFLNNEVTVAQFKRKSGGMGVYAQRGREKFMIRLRTPSGVIKLQHLRLIADFTDKYNLDKIHITTRQAIQLHDLDIDSVCDIMEKAIDNDLFVRGSGGDYPRNVSLSPLSGVDVDEVFDVTPYALKVGEYFMNNITHYNLPRKIKVAFSNNKCDTANATINDLGFIADITNGKPCFIMYLAGGMGANPSISIKYHSPINPEEVMYYVQAMLRLFEEEGDYNNRAKARIRYIAKRMGEKEFIKCFDKYLDEVKSEYEFCGIEPIINKDESAHTQTHLNLVPQRQKGLYSVILHPTNGQLESKKLKELYNFSTKVRNIEFRIGMDQSIYVRNLNREQSHYLIKIMKDIIAQNQVDMSLSCIGTPTCQMGMEQSQLLCKSILNKLKDNNVLSSVIPTIHISGCGNSCSRHQVGKIGFSGVRKRVNEKVCDAFELFIGGRLGYNKTSMGEDMGAILVEKIPDFICELAKDIYNSKVDYDSYINDKHEDLLLLINKYVI